MSSLAASPTSGAAGFSSPTGRPASELQPGLTILDSSKTATGMAEHVEFRRLEGTIVLFSRSACASVRARTHVMDDQLALG
jgi:hypothetical protein